MFIQKAFSPLGAVLAVLAVVFLGFNLRQSTVTFQPAVEIIRALQYMNNPTEAMMACALVQYQSIATVTRAGTNPIVQMRVDPRSPFYDCVGKFCAMPRPIDALAILVRKKYCGPT